MEYYDQMMDILVGVHFFSHFSCLFSSDVVNFQFISNIKMLSCAHNHQKEAYQVWSKSIVFLIFYEYLNMKKKFWEIAI